MAFFDLTGKVAFITGTSRGLGQYFARALAQAGADIAMSSRDASKLAPFRKEIEALGRRTCGVDLDVRDHDSIKAAVASVEKQMGRIDILVNNAGCNARKPALDHGGAELIGTDKRQLPVAGAGPAVFFGDHAAWGAGDARGPGGQRCERAGEAGFRRIFQQSAAREW